MEPTITIKMSYGKYAWCMNQYDGHESGHYLSKIHGRMDDPADKLMLDIAIDFPSVEADMIYVHDASNHLLQYSKCLSEPRCQFRFPVYEALAGTDIIFYFKKLLPRPPGFPVLGRTPMQDVYAHTVRLPSLLEYGDVNTCCICMSDLTPETKYITQCGHAFCLECFFGYAEHKHNVYSAGRCERFGCGHTIPKLTPLTCPLCQQEIIP